MSVMYDIDLVINQLQTVDELKTVAHSWTMDPLEDIDQARLPAALVFIGSETSTDAQSWNPVEQRVDPVVTVYIVAPVNDFKATREAILAALIGFQPPLDTEFSPLVHTNGRTHSLNGDAICWQDDYSCFHTRTET